jgi:hypothetical protein
MRNIEARISKLEAGTDFEIRKFEILASQSPGAAALLLRHIEPNIVWSEVRRIHLVLGRS